MWENFNKKLNKEDDSTLYCKNSTNVHAMTSACTLKLSSKTESIKKNMNEKLSLIVKKYIDSPEKLIQYLEMQGIKVYRLKGAEAFLAKFNEEEGFITPQKGEFAFFLNLTTGLKCEHKLKIGFETKPMAIFNDKDVEIYTVARALYKFYGFKHKLPGYDYYSQQTFKRMYNNRNDEITISPSQKLKDICACKEALARDLESINFTIQLAKEYENSKKALKKLKDTNSINI